MRFSIIAFFYGAQLATVVVAKVCGSDNCLRAVTGRKTLRQTGTRAEICQCKIQAQDQQLQRQEPKGSEGLKLQLEVANAELKILRLQVQLSAALNLEAAKYAESSSDWDLAYDGLETALMVSPPLEISKSTSAEDDLGRNDSTSASTVSTAPATIN